MSLFEKTIPVEPETITPLIKKYFNLTLGDRIKASQNHTYKATKGEENFIARITPDPKGEQFERIRRELDLINYVDKNGVNVAKPLPRIDGDGFVVNENGLVIVAFEYAAGVAVEYGDYKWKDNERLVETWGKWMGGLHVVLMKYREEVGEGYFRDWDELHDSIMKGVALHEDDVALMENPAKYGILHGDVNISNFFYLEEEGDLCVFDWDQVQYGWFAYDIALVLYSVYQLKRGGKLMTNEKVEVDEEAFTNWFIRGYESVEGIEPVDREHLHRMVLLRRSFYERFCRRAIVEIEGNEELAGMYAFCKWVVDWMDKEAESNTN